MTCKISTILRIFHDFNLLPFSLESLPDFPSSNRYNLIYFIFYFLFRDVQIKWDVLPEAELTYCVPKERHTQNNTVLVLS
jgi:hypothetical protein